jgi:protease-4
MIPNMKKFWNEKVGITFDGVKTNAHADLMTFNKPLDSAEFEAVQDMVGCAEKVAEFFAKNR